MAAESIEARAKRAAELEKLGEPGALDEALELRTEIVALCKTAGADRLLAEQRALVGLLIAGGDLGGATRVCEDMAAILDGARIDARPHLVHAWWAVGTAQQHLDATGAAQDAIFRLASLWRYRECTHAIETTLRDAKRPEPALYALLRTRVLAELAKEPPPSPLEREIAEHPEQTDLYLVLADELLAQGDPRGELIAIHHEMRAFPQGSSALARREYELLYHHHMRLLGPLEWGDAEWRLGFWHRARLAVRGDSEFQRVREFAVHRSALALDTLRLEIPSLDGVRRVAPYLGAIPRLVLPFFTIADLEIVRALLPGTALSTE